MYDTPECLLSVIVLYRIYTLNSRIKANPEQVRVCEELTHWERPWCQERLKAGRKGDERGWNGWMASLIQWIWIWVAPGVGDGPGSLAYCSPWGRKELDMTKRLNWTELSLRRRAGKQDRAGEISQGQRWFQRIPLVSIQKHRLGLTIRPGGRPFLPHASQSGCRAGGGNVFVCVIKNILYIYI